MSIGVISDVRYNFVDLVESVHFPIEAGNLQKAQDHFQPEPFQGSDELFLVGDSRR